MTSLDLLLDTCLAQIRFVINAPKQVMKPKGYVAAFDHADIVNKIMNR
jgi:hypothetical protein